MEIFPFIYKAKIGPENKLMLIEGRLNLNIIQICNTLRQFEMVYLMAEQPRQMIPKFSADGANEQPSSPLRNFFLHLEHVSHREWRGTSFDRSG